MMVLIEWFRMENDGKSMVKIMANIVANDGTLVNDG